MAYVLPRVILVLAGWAITCGLMMKLLSSEAPMIFYMTGASWILAGIVGFGYLRRLRREAQDQRSRY